MCNTEKSFKLIYIPIILILLALIIVCLLTLIPAAVLSIPLFVLKFISGSCLNYIKYIIEYYFGKYETWK